MLYYKNGVSYSMDGQPHCKVTDNDNAQGQKAAGDHQRNHIRRDSRVFISSKYIWSTRGLQAMRPIPVKQENDRDPAFCFTLYCCQWEIMFSTLQLRYLLHPKTGSIVQNADQTQVKRIPADAILPSNFTFPKGLHTTTHLSNDMTVKDHKPTIPGKLIKRFFNKS